MERTRRPEQRARYEAELQLPRMPVEVAYVWAMFWRLRNRVRNVNTHQPITWDDIYKYRDLVMAHIGPFEIELIELLDDLFLKAQAEAKNEEGGD
ncbi:MULTISPECIES: phage tail assembly chaperone [Mesorhizobium]|uniref:phage tail assembly chaperone n=1 Tax=Mesorhizobium TaxID=68287 RepID=UPI003CC97F27